MDAVCVDFELAFLIRRSQLTQPRADRRLNAIENTIAAPAHEWRPFRPLVPAKELRMAPDTLAQLWAWVDGAEAATGCTADRLHRYECAADGIVPAGCIRLRIPSFPEASAVGA